MSMQYVTSIFIIKPNVNDAFMVNDVLYGIIRR